MNQIFFYGLFMDAGLLRGRGLHPAVLGPAELPGYQIRIGNRASLIPNPQSRSLGMLIELSDEEAQALYSAPDVSDYGPDKVNVILLSDGSTQAALCYNLPPGLIGAGANHEYAERLANLVIELGFPSAYASEIRRCNGV